MRFMIGVWTRLSQKHTTGAKEVAEKSACVDWREGPGLKRVRKKSVCAEWRDGPGLKPLEFAGFFVG